MVRWREWRRCSRRWRSAAGRRPGRIGGRGGGPPDKPVKIRMGWGIPAEEIKYVMMKHPEVAEHLGTWYDIEWHQFSGTALGVQGLAAGHARLRDGRRPLGRQRHRPGRGHRDPRRVHRGAHAELLDGLDGAQGLRHRLAGRPRGQDGRHQRGRRLDRLPAGLLHRAGGRPEGRTATTRRSRSRSARCRRRCCPAASTWACSRSRSTAPSTRPARSSRCSGSPTMIEPFVQLLNGCRRDFVEDNEAVDAPVPGGLGAVARWIADPANRDAVVAGQRGGDQDPGGRARPLPAHQAGLLPAAATGR